MLTFSMTWIMPIVMRSLHHLSHKPNFANFEIKAARRYTTQSYTSEGSTQWFHKQFGIGHLTLASGFENLSPNHLPPFTKIQQQFSPVPHAFLQSSKGHGAALQAWRPACQPHVLLPSPTFYVPFLTDEKAQWFLITRNAWVSTSKHYFCSIIYAQISCWTLQMRYCISRRVSYSWWESIGSPRGRSMIYKSLTSK